MIELPILQCVCRPAAPPSTLAAAVPVALSFAHLTRLICSTRFLASFNDVYRVNQRYVPENGAANGEGGPRYITAAQFARRLDDVRDGWANSPAEAGEKEGLVLFSGGQSNALSCLPGNG
jgi:hypothetical protein